MARWSSTIQLVGAGGEPVDLARTLLSHGVADLPPNTIEPDGTRLSTVLSAGGRAWLVELLGDAPSSDRPTAATLGHPRGAPAPPAPVRLELVRQIRHMLCLDEDLSP